MKRDARAYFASNQDAVYDLIQLMSSQMKGPAGPVQETGFNILRRVSAATAAGASAVIGTPAAGDAFVRDDLTCMGIATSAGTFTGALGENGLFGVRAGTNDPTGNLVSRGTLLYGAEAPSGWTTSVSSHQQFLLYGYPRDFAFSSETPAALTAYELATIPAGLTFQPLIRVGVCQTTSATPRIQHVDVILAESQPDFCKPSTETNTSAIDNGHGVLALARLVTSWITPRPAYAATVLVGGMGGLLGGLSPIGAVNVDVTTGSLSFTQQPSDGRINRPISPAIAVKALTANRTPIDGLTITLVVSGNSGSFNIKRGSNVAVTANGGIATFPDFQTDKAGGYTLSATGSFDGGGTKTPPVTSVLFNVAGKR